MTDRELMQQALHTLEGWANVDDWVWPETAKEQAKRNTVDAIAALRERLAQPEPQPQPQPEQAPVAWMDVEGNIWRHTSHKNDTPLYTAPQRREWVGLTNREISEILCDDRWQGRPEYMLLQMQAKLKEKNNAP